MVEVNPRYHPQHGRQRVLHIAKQIREEDVRNLNYCIGCTKPKAVGLVVCWECFSRRTDIVPLKYFEGTLVEWLNQEKKKG